MLYGINNKVLTCWIDTIFAKPWGILSHAIITIYNWCLFLGLESGDMKLEERSHNLLGLSRSRSRRMCSLSSSFNSIDVLMSLIPIESPKYENENHKEFSTLKSAATLIFALFSFSTKDEIQSEQDEDVLFLNLSVSEWDEGWRSIWARWSLGRLASSSS